MQALVGGALIDGTGKSIQENSAVLIDNDTIVDVGPRETTTVPESCEVLDISGKILLPGLIDTHVHLHIGEHDLIIPSGGLPPELGQPLTFIGIKGYAHAKRAFEMGFTTIRDAGDVGYLSVALRDAVNTGIVEGPRIVASGQWLSATGGHADYLPLWLKRTDDASNVVDGIDDMLKAVRRQIKMKTDWIKLYVTGGIMDPEDKQEFTDDELKAAIDEAHGKEKYVMGHCMHARGTLAGLKAGLDTIEHGTDLTEEIVELMLQKGTCLVPTIAVQQAIVNKGQEFGLPQTYVERFAAHVEKGRKSFAMALKAGVPIALGTDAGFNVMLHGENAKELEALAGYGMSPMQAIVAATSQAASALRLGDKIGTVERGKLADLIVVNGNPLEDLLILQDSQNILLVMKEGTICINRM